MYLDHFRSTFWISFPEVTHGPPRGAWAKKVLQKRPRLHVFGHDHETWPLNRTDLKSEGFFSLGFLCVDSIVAVQSTTLCKIWKMQTYLGQLRKNMVWPSGMAWCPSMQHCAMTSFVPLARLLWWTSDEVCEALTGDKAPSQGICLIYLTANGQYWRPTFFAVRWRWMKFLLLVLWLMMEEARVPGYHRWEQRCNYNVALFPLIAVVDDWRSVSFDLFGVPLLDVAICPKKMCQMPSRNISILEIRCRSKRPGPLPNRRPNCMRGRVKSPLMPGLIGWLRG